MSQVALHSPLPSTDASTHVATPLGDENRRTSLGRNASPELIPDARHIIRERCIRKIVLAVAMPIDVWTEYKPIGKVKKSGSSRCPMTFSPHQHCVSAYRRHSPLPPPTPCANQPARTP